MLVRIIPMIPIRIIILMVMLQRKSFGYTTRYNKYEICTFLYSSLIENTFDKDKENEKNTFN